MYFVSTYLWPWEVEIVGEVFGDKWEEEKEVFNSVEDSFV